jgi:hypothetical protein
MTRTGFSPNGEGRKFSVSRAKLPSGFLQNAGTEPPLESLLSDPVLLMVLARNGLTVEQLRELSVSVGERLRRC